MEGRGGAWIRPISLRGGLITQVTVNNNMDTFYTSIYKQCNENEEIADNI